MWNTICEALSLGRLTEPPVRLTGGYSHRMYALTTDAGRYAVKLLNPEIMNRPGVMADFRCAEAFEARMEAAGLPILPALTIGGCKMQRVNGQYLYVFDYFDGRPLADTEITPAHCEKMGDTLARIHAIDRRVLPGAPDMPEPVEWHALSEALLSSPDAREEGEALRDAEPMLMRVTAAADEALLRLPRIQATCHNDMDTKNVLWQGAREAQNEFRVIDLECLGWADPMREMLDLAISWAGYPIGEERFRAFVGAYFAAGGELTGDPALIFDSRRNHIDWLAYNARRALFDDEQERAVGREQVRSTIGKIAYDQHNRATILAWMREA